VLCNDEEWSQYVCEDIEERKKERGARHFSLTVFFTLLGSFS
jgi:hypothetical protein